MLVEGKQGATVAHLQVPWYVLSNARVQVAASFPAFFMMHGARMSEPSLHHTRLS